MSPAIFRQYDIRGVWGKDLTEEVAELIGRAFASYLLKSVNKDKTKVTIGRDVRLHSKTILDNLIRGLNNSGIDVIDLGVCPTPLQYYSLFKLPVDGGVMITGSHNPPEFNGFKLSVGKETLFGDKIKAIEGIINLKDFKKGRGGIESYPIIDDYIDFMKDKFPDLSGLKVVIDAGNGTGGLVAPKILKELGVDVFELYCEPDGRFPNHHPDPTIEKNLIDLIRKVKELKAHVGMSYDGDADRIGVIDEGGEIIWGDRLMIIFARDIIESQKSEVRSQPTPLCELMSGKSKKPVFIGEVKCSQVMYDEIERLGGRAIMWKTGHSLIKEKLKEEHAVLAGEMSGHMFFADRYFGYDDAIYASLRLLEVLKKSGKPYSTKALLKDTPHMISTPEIRVDCPDEIKFGIVEKVKEAFKEYPLVTIDGIRIKFNGGWGLIRASNTQPALVLRFEAKDEATLKEIKDFVEGALNKIINFKSL
ncbi:MAG: phosphomannomutase/phosphoglucomutase [Nitrospirae bacterium]|nr:phosphomannomutase/phosphoglucomutase [Nitrospirota bacterium]